MSRDNFNPPPSWYELPEDPRELAHEWWYENIAPEDVDQMSDLEAWDLFEAWYESQREEAMERMAER